MFPRHSPRALPLSCRTRQTKQPAVDRRVLFNSFSLFHRCLLSWSGTWRPKVWPMKQALKFGERSSFQNPCRLKIIIWLKPNSSENSNSLFIYVYLYFFEQDACIWQQSLVQFVFCHFHHCLYVYICQHFSGCCLPELPQAFKGRLPSCCSKYCLLCSYGGVFFLPFHAFISSILFISSFRP